MSGFEGSRSFTHSQRANEARNLHQAWCIYGHGRNDPRQDHLDGLRAVCA